VKVNCGIEGKKKVLDIQIKLLSHVSGTNNEDDAQTFQSSVNSVRSFFGENEGCNIQVRRHKEAELWTDALTADAKLRKEGQRGTETDQQAHLGETRLEHQ
jgi:hypothetical protein